MYYSFDYEIPNFLCDNRDTLTMWGCARLMQQAADNHTKLFGIGFEHLSKHDKAWVLCHTYYDVRRMPKEYEVVKVRTWSRLTDGLYAWRDFEMTDEAGNVIVAATTSWVVIDMVKRRVVRLGEILQGFESHPDKATPYDRMPRIRMPKDAVPQLVEEHKKICYSMLDHTQHVNNAEYIKWIFDNLPAGATPEAPYQLDVEYYQETHPDEEVSISIHHQDGKHYYQIDNPRATSVLATLTFTN